MTLLGLSFLGAPTGLTSSDSEKITRCTTRPGTGNRGNLSLTDWQPLGGTFNSPPSAVSWTANRLDIFGLGKDNQMYHKAWNGQSWEPSLTDWQPLGGTFNSPPS